MEAMTLHPLRNPVAIKMKSMTLSVEEHKKQHRRKNYANVPPAARAEKEKKNAKRRWNRQQSQHLQQCKFLPGYTTNGYHNDIHIVLADEMS
jgi:hypothetical protein